MMARRSVLLVTGIIALSGILCSGCSYMRKRGNDALDMFDIGVTVSQTPGFSLYSSCFEIFTVGYSNVDGRFHGLCRRRVGSFPLRHNATGVLVWGYEQLGYDEVDFADPDSPESWRVGQLTASLQISRISSWAGPPSISWATTCRISPGRCPERTVRGVFLHR